MLNLFSVFVSFNVLALEGSALHGAPAPLMQLGQAQGAVVGLCSHDPY